MSLLVPAFNCFGYIPRNEIAKSYGSSGFLGGASGTEPTWKCRRHRFDPCIRKIPWRREWLPTPVFWSGEFHGQSLCPSPWDRKELDMTERLTHRPPMPRKGAWTLKILYMKKKLWTLLNKKHGIWFMMVQHGNTIKNRLERCESERNFQLAFIHWFLSSGL